MTKFDDFRFTLAKSDKEGRGAFDWPVLFVLLGVPKLILAKSDKLGLAGRCWLTEVTKLGFKNDTRLRLDPSEVVLFFDKCKLAS